MMTARVVEYTGGGPGNRYSGSRLRGALELALAGRESCALDFTDVDTVTQSLADEVVGVLVRSRGPEVLDHMTFTNCSPVVRDTLQFVADYSAHYWETGSFPTPQPA